MDISNMVFVGFGKYVVALDRDTGAKIWAWKSPKGMAYAAVLLDGDRLIVSVMGYTFCLEPLTGRVLWENDLEGLGTGVACITTARGSTGVQRGVCAAAEQEQSASAGSGS